MNCKSFLKVTYFKKSCCIEVTFLKFPQIFEKKCRCIGKAFRRALSSLMEQPSIKPNVISKWPIYDLKLMGLGPIETV